QMLRPLVGRDRRGRRTLLTALGSFFLGNEVWLVAFGGVLLGAFPVFEGELFGGVQALVVLILVGIVLGNAAVQLVGRAAGDAGLRWWGGLVIVGGVLPSVSWGLLLG